MFYVRHALKLGICFVVVALVAFLLNANSGCGRQLERGSASDQNSEANATIAEASPADAEPVDPSLVERIKKERWTGDLSGMAERRFIRVLVTYNRTHYFYDGIEARGLVYEAMKEFERFANQKLNRGTQPIGMIELIAVREIGPETVTYVSNIFKYYVAFKLVEEAERKKSSKKP